MRYSCLIVMISVMAVNAAAQTQEQILPVVLNGFIREPLHYQTTIRIVNLSTSAFDVTLEAYQNDGAPIRILELFPIAQTGTKTVLNLPASGSIEVFTYGDVPSLDGWVRLTYPSSASIQGTAEVAVINAPVGPHPVCRRPSNEIVTSVDVPAVQAAQRFSGSAVIRPNRKGGFALINSSTTASATVFLSLMDPSGKLVESATIDVPPQGRVSRLLTEYFPNMVMDFMGSLRVTSSAGIAVGAVNVIFPEGKLGGVTLTPAPPVACIQVLAPARNPLTGECRVFPTPCDIPDGWERTSSCN
jgi:hypothetical protein